MEAILEQAMEQLKSAALSIRRMPIVPTASSASGPLF